MFKHAANVAPLDQAIIKGILDGFGEVLDVNKIEKFNAEIKKLFATIKEDSTGLSQETIYQIAFHLAKNRAKVLVTKKETNKIKDTPTVVKETESVADSAVIPISDRSTEKIRDVDITNLRQEEPSSLIQRAILNGFGSVGKLTYATTVEHINDEANKLYKIYIEKSSKYETDYQLYEQVFKVAKNIAESIVFAYDELEQKQSRKDQIIRKRREAEQAELEKSRISEIAIKELQELITQLVQDKSLSPASIEALKYFKFIYIDNKKDPEIVHLFPGTSRDQRYKWKERAVSMIVPLISEDTRKYISGKTKRKYASANTLYKVAQIFLYRCQEGFYE